jgi:hypothetical protein
VPQAIVLKRLSGAECRVVIPLNGAVVASTSKWTLTRLGDGPGHVPGYRFQGVLSYLDSFLFNHQQLTKEVIIVLRDRTQGFAKEYRIEPMPGEVMALNGMILTCERVTLHGLSDAH